MDTQLMRRERRPLLAWILLGEGALDAQQCTLATLEWLRCREEGRAMPFGAVVLSLGFLDTQALRPYLVLLRAIAPPPAERPFLGMLAIQLGLLRPSRLRQALRVCRRTRRPLGEVLIEAGWLGEIQLDVLLRWQNPSPSAVP